MHPVLLSLPSKLVFAFAVVGGLALLAGDLFRALAWRRVSYRYRHRRRPVKARLNSMGPLLLVGAWLILRLRGSAWLPSGEAFAHPWPDIPIYAYATMLWLSFVAGWLVVMRFAAEDELQPRAIGALYVAVAVASLIGGRLLFVLTNRDLFHGAADVLGIWNGGLVAYGGMLGGFLASVLLCRQYRVPLLRWADVAAPAVALGTAITRVGCFLFGCDFGTRTELPWAVRFPIGSPVWLLHRGSYGLPADARLSFPVHPTQLYELAVGLALFGWLVWLRARRTFDGQIFIAWVIGYGVLRTLLEAVRDDVHRGRLGPFSTSQVIGLISALIAASAWIVLSRIAEVRARTAIGPMRTRS